MFGNAMLEIALVSLGVVALSQLLQWKFLDKKGMKEMQGKIKENQKKLKELMGKEDSKSKQEAERLQKEMLELMGKNMQSTMRHMIITFPIFIAVYWALGQAYGHSLLQLPFELPVVHRNFTFEITSGVSWLWWYIYTSLVFSIGFGIVKKVFGRKKEVK